MRKSVYAAVVKIEWGSNQMEVYSSFFDDRNRAIEHAEKNPGVIRIEEAHSADPRRIVWTRNQAKNHGKERA